MKLFKVLLIITSLFLLTSCKHTEDLNGDDNFNLATYTLDDIRNNNIRTRINFGKLESNTLTSGFVKYRKFSGLNILSIRKVSKGNKIEITSNVESGNLGIYIRCNNEYHQIPINQTYIYEFDNSQTYTILYVGESGKFRIDYKYLY